MKKFRQAQCPYCGQKPGILQSWSLKKQGEYHCPQCGSYSNIELDAATYPLGVAAILISGIIYAVSMLLNKELNFYILIGVLLPYLLFYSLSVFLVRLRKPVVRKKPPAVRGKPPESNPQGTNH